MELFGSGGLQEGGFVTASNGTISVVHNAPHHNAAKLYFELSSLERRADGLEQSLGIGEPQARCPKGSYPGDLLPEEGVSYQETYIEKSTC